MISALYNHLEAIPYAVVPYDNPLSLSQSNLLTSLNHLPVASPKRGPEPEANLLGNPRLPDSVKYLIGTSHGEGRF